MGTGWEQDGSKMGTGWEQDGIKMGDPYSSEDYVEIEGGSRWLN